MMTVAHCDRCSSGLIDGFCQICLIDGFGQALAADAAPDAAAAATSTSLASHPGSSHQTAYATPTVLASHPVVLHAGRVTIDPMIVHMSHLQAEEWLANLFVDGQSFPPPKQRPTIPEDTNPPSGGNGDQWSELCEQRHFQQIMKHGDFNRHNMLFTRQRPTRLAAVLDWENATVGDPLMHLGYLLSGWRPEDADLPSRAELVGRWSIRTGRTPEALGWYAVMSTFKLACMLEGVRVRQVDDPTREVTPFLADAVLDLVSRASELINEAASG